MISFWSWRDYLLFFGALVFLLGLAIAFGSGGVLIGLGFAIMWVAHDGIEVEEEEAP